MHDDVGTMGSRLVEIERLLTELAEKVSPQLPLTLRREHAARLLDVSASSVKAMIRRGEIIPTRVSGRQMVPTSEVLRIATPQAPVMKLRALGSSPAKRSPRAAKTEAEKIRAAVRKPRKTKN